MTGMPISAAIEPPMGTPDIIIVATAARHFAGDQLCGKCIGGRHEAAQAESGDQTQCAEHDRSGRQRTQRGEYGQDDRASDHRAFASHHVGEASREHGADHHPEECEAAERARGRGADAPFLLQARDDVAVDDEVVAVEDHEQPADDDGDHGGAVQSDAVHRWRRGGGSEGHESRVMRRTAHVQ